MSVASRIQEIETHIGDIYGTLEVGGTDLTDLNKNIVNINSSLKDRYKYFLNNGVEIIWNNWEKVIGEGTEFTLENTIQAPMKINLKGNTYQKSTTGKNLLDISKVISNWNSSTNIGVRNNNDGTLTVSTPSTSSSVQALAPNKLSDYCPSLQVGDKVYITATTTGTQKYVYLTTSASVWTYGTLRTISQNDLDSAVLWYSSGVSATATISDIMISTSGGEYEPYTGKNPAPNPDYPQDIQVVSGDNSIEVVGKNLFDKDSITVSNHYIDVNGGTTSAPDWLCTYDYVKIEPNTDYIVSFENMGARFIWAEYDENKTCIGNRHENTTGAIQTSSTAKYIRFCTNNPNATDIQLENGTQVTSYQPYQKESYPINLGDIELCEISDYKDDFIRNSGKNLFDKNDYSYYDGYISGTGTTSIVSATNNKIIYIPCLSNTQYTISKIISMRFRIGYSIDIPNADINVYGVLNNDNGTSLTITTGDDAKYLVVYLQNGNLSGEKSLEDIINSLQIEEGDQVTEYEPYGTGKWYLHKEIGKVVLDGSENWALNSSSGDSYRYWLKNTTSSLAFTDIFTNIISGGEATLVGKLLCNYFTQKIFEQTYIGAFSINVGANENQWFLLNVSETSLENFKNWLSTHNTIVYYVLATPTYTEITDITLINQLEAIKYSYNNQTNISQVNNDMPFKLEVTALKNI